MGQPKKGQLYNVVFPMVDSTDFASLESGITASDFNSAATRQYIGYDIGASATAAFSDLSKTTNLVTSGIFHHVLNETETDFDILMVRFTHPSCADQLLIFYPEDYTQSDLMSRISDIGSDLRSYLVGMSGMLSDIDSQLLLNASMISDVQSALSNVHSDLLSYLAGLSGAISDVDSQLNLNASVISDVQSALDSQFLIVVSNISDVDSQVNLLTTSNYLSQVHSDLASAIGAITASVSASDMSDIASRVWATTEGTRVDSRILVIQSMVSDVDSQLLLNASMISDVQSALDSQFLIITSNISDIDSQLNLVATSDYLSQVHSDIISAIGNVSVTLTASDISDIASAVAVAVGSDISDVYSLVQNVDSQLLLNASMISDVYSNLSDLKSDFQSRIPKAVATNSQLSDLVSDLLSYLTGVSGIVSDVQSALDSQYLVLTSTLSDIDSQVNLLATSDYLSQVHSDLVSAVGGITVSIGVSDISDIASAVWADTIGARVDSRVLVIQSMVSDVDSQLTATDTVVSSIYDLLSDVESQVDLNASMISDVESQVDLLATSNYLSQVHSDLASAVGAVTASLDASDISNMASAVWAAGTRTLTTSTAQVVAGVSGSEIEVLRGDTWEISITDLGSIAGRTTLWFTAKDNKSKTDAEALVQVTEGDGLVYINGASAGTPANGSITVDDEDAGDITIVIDEVETALLSGLRSGHYDVQVFNGGDVTTLTSGTFTIEIDVTKATS